MKKTRFLAALLAAALLLATAAFAAEPASVSSGSSSAQPYRLSAELTVVSTDFESEHPSLIVTDASGNEMQLNLSASTAVLDTQTGLPASLSSVKKGGAVFAFYGPASTRSIPPQYACEALVVNLTDAHAPAHLLTAERVTVNTDGSVTVLAESGSLLLTIPASAAVSPYKMKNIVKSTDIRMGTRFFAWYDVVALSMPGQAGTDKVVLLPQADGALTMLHEGDIAIGEAKIENGVVMVPLRKAAEALGFTVTWNAKERTVGLNNGTVQTIVTPGMDSYYMASAIPGAIGMSAPSALGAASYIVKGVTWAPAELLNLLLGDSAVTLRGSTLLL